MEYTFIITILENWYFEHSVMLRVSENLYFFIGFSLYNIYNTIAFNYTNKFINVASQSDVLVKFKVHDPQ